MQCPHCETENEENAKFCCRCGKKMFDTPIAATLDQTYDPELLKVNVRLSTRTKLIIAALAILIVSGIAYQFITKPLTPNQVAAKFMENLQKGDYSKAYSYLDESCFIGREYLSQECFQEAFAQNKVSEYKLDAGTGTKSEVSQTNFHYILNSGGQRSEGVLKLVNNPTGKKDNWKIDPSNFIINTEICTLPDVTVKINEQPVKIENGSITLPMFNGFSFQVSMENPDIKPLEIDSQAGKQVDGTLVEPSPALQESIKTQINGLNSTFIQAVKDLNSANYSKFVKEGSDEWRDLDNQIMNLRNNQIIQESILKDIKINNIRFARSLKTVNADSEETWDSSYKNADGQVIRQDNNHLIRWTYTLEKQDDGSWLITKANQR